MSESIFLAEYSSVSHGIMVLDRMVKRSAVEILYARPVCAGRHLIVVGGNVDDVAESRAEVEAMGLERRVSSHLLTNTHQDILAYFRRTPEQQLLQPAPAVGLLETTSAAAGFHSLDAALKNGSVQLGRVWLGHFLAGKFCCVLTGQVADVQSAVSAARASIPEKSLVDSRVIPSPDPMALQYLR